jgi:hypothetical protein
VELDRKTEATVNATLAALTAGTPAEEALRQLSGAAIDAFVEWAAGRMQQQIPAVAARRRDDEARITRRWGAALDAYYAVTVAAAEIAMLASRHSPVGQGSSDSVTAALTLLHARTCQTSFEVHTLLAAGFPGGAYSRYRTLHELAVTAAVIAQYGRRPAHADLADRYLSHGSIEHCRQAEERQRTGRELGWQPIPDSAMKELKKLHDALIVRYGPDYSQPYGWATGLLGRHPNFAKLEAKADMAYLRYLYVTGSHLIHASAHGLRLTVLDLGSANSDVFIKPSDTGLAQPAEASLNALIDVTGGLVLHGGEKLDASPVYLNFLGLHELRRRAVSLFYEAEDQGSTQDT